MSESRSQSQLVKIAPLIPVILLSAPHRDSDNAQQTERKENTVRKVDLQRRAVKLIKQLSTKKLKAGRIKRSGEVKQTL